MAHVQVSPTGAAKGHRARLVTGSQLPGHLEKSGWLVLFSVHTEKPMRISTYITCVFLAGILGPAYSQEGVITPRESRSQQISQAYGFMVSQNQLLSLVAAEYPSLASEVGAVMFAFETSALGKGAAELEGALKAEAGNEWPGLKSAIEKGAKENTKQLALTNDSAKEYLAEVKLRARGKLPESVRNILLALNPAYVTSPGAELAEGWRQTYSTKAHPKSEGAEITLALPLSWNKREGNQAGIVQVFRSGAGHGPIMCNIFCKKVNNDSEGDATLQDMNGFFTNENLTMMARSMGRMIDARRITIAGAPGGVVVFDSKQEMLGMMTEARTTNFTIIHKKHLIQVNFVVAKQFLNGVTFDEAQRSYYPTYLMIMSTLTRN